MIYGMVTTCRRLYADLGALVAMCEAALAEPPLGR